VQADVARAEAPLGSLPLHNDMILVERATTKLMYVHLTFIPIPGVWAGGLIR
jgi:hypothetical protein